MKDVQNIQGLRITMDTLEESAILIQLSDGNVLTFNYCYDGLYYYNMAQGADSKNKKLNLKVQLPIIIQTYCQNL